LVKRAQDIEKLGAKTTKQLSSKFIENEDAVQSTFLNTKKEDEKPADDSELV
jgi:hypothetical protein